MFEQYSREYASWCLSACGSPLETQRGPRTRLMDFPFPPLRSFFLRLLLCTLVKIEEDKLAPTRPPTRLPGSCEGGHPREQASRRSFLVWFEIDPPSTGVASGCGMPCPCPAPLVDYYEGLVQAVDYLFDFQISTFWATLVCFKTLLGGCSAPKF